MFAEIQKNLISIVVLVILFVTLIRQLNWKNYINKIFFYMIGMNIALIVLDSAILLLSGKQFEGARFALMLSVGIYYALAPIFALFWLYYVEMTIFQSKDRLIRISVIPCIIILANFILIITSYSSNMIFNISDENIFTRGSQHYLVVVASFLILIITNYQIFKYKSQIRKKDFMPLLLFAIPPVVSSFILLIFKDINLIWNSLIVSQLLIYIYIQSKITSTDFLTGLYNRREYEMTVKDLSMIKNKHVVISGIMVDINEFKDINDQFGHRVGDEVLIATAKLLKSAIRKQDYVFRIGGDEFLVIITSDDKTAVNQVTNRIEEVLKHYNQNSDYSFTLSFSLGTGVYDDKTYVDIPSFFEHLDLMMYDDKKYFKEHNES
ncbi:MAG: GGDEF domain-containing protein [Acholeplasmataceae bacterium]